VLYLVQDDGVGSLDLLHQEIDHESTLSCTFPICDVWPLVHKMLRLEIPHKCTWNKMASNKWPWCQFLILLGWENTGVDNGDDVLESDILEQWSTLLFSLLETLLNRFWLRNTGTFDDDTIKHAATLFAEFHELTDDTEKLVRERAANTSVVELDRVPRIENLLRTFLGADHSSGAGL